MFPSKFDFFRSGLQGQFIGRLLLAASMMPWNCQGVVSSDHDEPLFSRSKMKGAKSVLAMTPSLARFFKDSNQKSLDILDCRSFPGCQMWCRAFARSDHVCFVSGLFVEGLMPGIPLSARHFVETLTFDLPKLAWHGLTLCKAMGAWANHGHHICSFENRAPRNPMASQHGHSPSCHFRGSTIIIIIGQTQASPNSKHLQTLQFNLNSFEAFQAGIKVLKLVHPQLPSLKWQHGFEGRRMRGAIRHHLDVGALAPGNSLERLLVHGKLPNHGKEYPKHPLMNS